MSPALPSATGACRLDIDNPRNLAVFALILFHTARLFNNEAWHFKDAQIVPWADWIVRVINEPHLPLFFLGWAQGRS